MFEDQLFLVIGFENNRVFIEAPDAAGQLHSTHQVNRQERLVSSGIVQECLLYVLCKLVHLSLPAPAGRSGLARTNPPAANETGEG